MWENALPTLVMLSATNRARDSSRWTAGYRVGRRDLATSSWWLDPVKDVSLGEEKGAAAGAGHSDALPAQF